MGKKYKIELEEQKKIQLEIMKKVKQVCDLHNINYFLGGGTLLGAVRHKGYIPWDDDIDIMLPREDYEKLLKIFNEEQEKNDFKLLSFYNTEDYYYPFAKIVDKRTQLEEIEFRKIKDMGVYIDVFPIDFLPNDNKKMKKIFKKYQILHGLISIYQMSNIKLSTENKFKLKIKQVLLPILENNKVNKYILRKIDNIGKKYINTDKVACISGRYLEKEIMESDYISNYTLLEFEGENFKAPIGYDAYLTKHYGDYMTLPPKEKQVLGHNNIAYWRKKG